MTENVISLTPLMERDDRTQPEKQLANELGVEIGEEISDALQNTVPTLNMLRCSRLNADSSSS